MSGSLAGALSGLETATARRRGIEQRVFEHWQDRVRRDFEARVVTPLNTEVAQVRAAIEELSSELNDALRRLNV